MSKQNHSSLTATYITGFVLSILLTLAAYFAVTEQLASRTGLIVFIMSLAMLQLIVQLYYFLHLGDETKPRLNLGALLFAILVFIIIVVGSIWIMNNLSYNHGQGDEIDSYIMEEELIYPNDSR